MHKIISSCLLIAGTFIIGSPNFKASGVLNLEITELKNSDGNVKISVFNSADGFPKENEKAVRLLSEKIKDNKVSVTFDGLPEGEYAIAILHDENDNNKMDFTFYGKPKEGFGFSNNPKLSFGPPDFSKAKFKLASDAADLQIKTKYY